MVFLKGMRPWIAAAVLSLCLPVAMARAQADQAFPNASVGVIDDQKILLEANAAQGARKDSQAYAVKYSEQARKDEQKIHEAQGALAREADQTSEAFRQKRQDFDKQVADFQKKITTLRRNLDKALALALDQVQTQMFEAARDVAAERGINLVMRRAQLLLFDPRMDLTEEVLKRVNDSLPAVTFPDPESLTQKEK
ncbi:MAG: OmpH family outer membrane protein [Rhodospirillum sp.]|nr:OmpH family outer membrane protein [Rhodospirillum sp.]MCF8488451.1 OmpH family outer membrane protein [Rhodospirillum sp.]MCF8499113.1 OmpH family outer membrane protein [Rhodospirillum sp.]